MKELFRFIDGLNPETLAQVGLVRTVLLARAWRLVRDKKLAPTKQWMPSIC